MPTEEPISLVEAYGTAAAKEELRAAQESRQAEIDKATLGQPHPKKIRFDNITAAPSERLYNISIGQAIRRKLVNHTTPINPHTDTYPMSTPASSWCVRGSCHVQQGQQRQEPQLPREL
jgi:hypothetical protein